jgi:hypothetical protein
MKFPLKMVAIAALILSGTACFAQSAAPAPTATPEPAPKSSAAAPVATGKRMGCQATTQAMKGQDRKDQMQLCMAQAHVDCLKQAIDQKLIGPQRKDFMKTCLQ